MTTSSTNTSIRELVDGMLIVITGAGVVTLALAPLAIPILALTAVALVPLLIPLLLIPLAGGLIAAPILLARRLFRRAAVPVKRETRLSSEFGFAPRSASERPGGA
jgi:hypothetical protein